MFTALRPSETCHQLKMFKSYSVKIQGYEGMLKRNPNQIIAVDSYLSLQVHLFVCNTDEDIKAAFEVGATGVMSDYPALLSSYLSRNRSQD